MELKCIRMHFVYGNTFVIIMSRVITNIFLYCIALHLSRVTIKDAFAYAKIMAQISCAVRALMTFATKIARTIPPLPKSEMSSL